MNASRGNQAQPQPLRNMSMNQYGAQPSSRQTPRLQNTQKTGLGNGNAGANWSFGTPASANGFGGLAGGAPGLAQGRSQLTAYANAIGGGSGQAPIDLSDFPTLSGPPRQQQNSGGWNSNNAIRQPPVQQQQPQQSSQQAQLQSQQRTPSAAPSHANSADHYDGARSQQPSGDHGGGANEFPPLGGQLNGDGMRTSNGFGSTLDSPEESHPQPNGQHSQLPIRDASNTFSQPQQAPIGSQAQTPQSQPAPSQSPQTSQPSQPVKKWSEMTDQEHFGLAGLSAIFEARKQFDIGGVVDETLPPQMSNSILFMSQDLNQLGMDLDSPEPLHPTFHVFPDATGTGSLFDSRKPVPAFNVPDAYTVTNVPPMATRIDAFSDETLLQIFYTSPRDVMQERAAEELSNREWRWHKLLRRWLQKDTREANLSIVSPSQDLTNGAPIGIAPQRIDERSERGIYIFFDPVNWRRERREHTLDYDALDNRQPSGVAINAINAMGVGGSGNFSAPPGMGMSGSGAVANQGVGSIERQSSVITGA
ncbi:uncharacterized protein RCC_03511 [Ramularia collo-cygni]|uniref:NOT2/NOT3/NOT5 C-terminal domain-containing protein n=1 Tax=Ramularia collo-cygni TaxID=112498 RepID=A0A2D3V589_9PEZI|nr:uncharacterized protein RCC_03511 [Ramularia collo-cygni]CZT17674.1 uncharacterized protein RCC_03511 [Ramularia collo-cygni]